MQYVDDRKPEQAKQTRSVVLQVRITPRADEELAKVAKREDRSKSDTARLLLSYGITRMPKGYTGR